MVRKVWQKLCKLRHIQYYHDIFAFSEECPKFRKIGCAGPSLGAMLPGFSRILEKICCNDSSRSIILNMYLQFQLVNSFSERGPETCRDHGLQPLGDCAFELKVLSNLTGYERGKPYCVWHDVLLSD